MPKYIIHRSPVPCPKCKSTPEDNTCPTHFAQLKEILPKYKKTLINLLKEYSDSSFTSDLEIKVFSIIFLGSITNGHPISLLARNYIPRDQLFNLQLYWKETCKTTLFISFVKLFIVELKYIDMETRNTLFKEWERYKKRRKFIIDHTWIEFDVKENASG